MMFSVVVIFYNQERYINRALYSIIHQTHRDLDIIVIDDGSDETIEDVVGRFGDSRIRFFRKPNGGPASARNRGIKEAKGKYIAFLDGDDVFLPNKIECMDELLNRHSWPVCIAACGAYVVTPQERFVAAIDPRAYSPGDLIDTFLVLPSCSIYHADVFKDMGGFPEALQTAEDGALNALLSQHYPTICTRERLVLYQMDSGGLARKKLNDYDAAIAPINQMIAFLESRIDPLVASDYRGLMYTHLLYGFLSAGNLSFARQWRKDVGSDINLRSFQGILARFSLMLDCNLYWLVRKFRQSMKMVVFFPAWCRLRSYLFS